MPATATSVALLGQFAAPLGSTLLSQYPNPNSYDLLQLTIPGIMDGQGGKVALRVSSTGVVSTFSTSGTLGTLFGVYQATGATTSSTTAQLIAAAFPVNPQNLDIIQIWNPQGETSIWHLDYQGISQTP